MNVKKILCCLAILGLCHQALADVPSDAGSRGYKFLQQGISARVLALGGAGTALRGDHGAAYWNPAGLVGLVSDSQTPCGSQISAEHTAWLADIGYDALGFAWTIPSGTMALSGLFQSSGDLPYTASLRDGQYIGVPEPSGTFGVYDGAVWASYGRLWNAMRVGGSLRYVYEKIHTATAHAVAVDVGAQYDLGGYTLGAVVRNLGISSELREVRTPLPWDAKIGVARTITLPGAIGTVLATADLRTAPDAYETVHVGAEARLWNHLALMGGVIAGVAQQVDNQGASVGFGINWGRLRFDYAVRWFSHSLGTPHTLALTLHG